MKLVRVLAVVSVVAAVAACGSTEESVSSSQEELGCDASKKDGAHKDDDEEECREINLEAERSGPPQKWVDDKSISPPASLPIPGKVDVDQLDQGFYTVDLALTGTDGGVANCTYSGGGKKSAVYTLSSCTFGLQANSVVEAKHLRLSFTSPHISEVELEAKETGCKKRDASIDATTDANKDASLDTGADVEDAGADAFDAADTSIADVNQPDTSDAATCDPSTCVEPNLCNGTKSCQNGVCVQGPPPVINNSNPCNIGSCDPKLGVTYSPAPANTSCGSTNVCTGTQTCDGKGTCVQNPPAVINNSNPCDIGSCDPKLGVTYTPAPANTSCGSTNVCTGTQTCDGKGTCVQNPPAVINNSNACNIGSCDPKLGVTYSPAPANTSCGSTNVCTGTQTCDGAGTCVQNPPAVINNSNPCNVGSCDPKLGVTYSPAPANTSCGSTNVCTGTQTCDGKGACVQNPPAVINNSNPCLVGSCDPKLGVTYSPAPANTSCGSTNVCTGTQTCDGAGTCVQNPPAVINNSNPCLVGSCDPKLGVTYTPAPANSACGSTNVCTGTQTCDGSGTCVQNPPAVINNNNPCLVGSCDPKLGVTYTPAPANTSCGSTNVCTGTQTCNGAGTCVQNPPAVIDHSNVCNVGTCDPKLGVTYTLIPNCDPSPTVGDLPFETRASLIGAVVDGNGNGVTGSTFSVFDVPVSGPARSDVALSTGSDGSFRIRLTQFPSSEAPDSPPHHVVVTIDAPNAIRVFRDAYLHPGMAMDFGPITVTPRDPKITVIGVAGGSASDSLNRVTVLVPPGALSADTPIQITPFTAREQLPFPLPDATVTTYGIELEPNGTQFSQPVLVKISNWQMVPSNLTLSVGWYNEKTSQWEHLALAPWNGSAFTFQTTHFSTLDANGGRGGLGDLIVSLEDGRGNAGHKICGGSSIDSVGGSLGQMVTLPGYTHRDAAFGLGLTYDSGLAGSRALNSSNQSNSISNAVANTHVSVQTAGGRLSAVCVPHGNSSGGAAAPGTCNAGSCSLASVVGPLSWSVNSGPGTHTSSSTSAANQQGVDVSDWLDLPQDSNGDPVGSSFFTQHLTLRSGAKAACVSGGGSFGVQDNVQPPQQTNLDAGPVVTVDRTVFVHHRHNSVFGAGWGLAGVDRIYQDPQADHVVMIGGDGTLEHFRPRVTYKAGPTVHANWGSKLYTALARDAATNEIFFIDSLGTLGKLDPNTNTFTTVFSGLSVGNVQGLAVAYVSGVRHFEVATPSGLQDLDGNGNLTALIARDTALETFPKNAGIFSQSHVAALGELVYYTDGNPLNNVIYRVRLSDKSQSTITQTANGDLRIDPNGALASTVQLTGPAGMAFGSDGSLYVADRRRNIVLRLALDNKGEVSGNSPTNLLMGTGAAGAILPVGDRRPGVRFTIDQPVFLSTWSDGTLLLGTAFGVAQYNPNSTEAKWLFFDATDSRSDLNIYLTGKGAGDYGSLLALGRTTAYINVAQTRVYKFDVTGLSSRFAPMRKLSLTNGAYTLDDPDAEIQEAFDTSGRMTERIRRSGEPLFAVQYLGNSATVSAIADPENNLTKFAYDGTTGKIVSITDPQNRVTNFSVDQFGDLVSIKEPDAETTAFTYEGHHMTTKTSPALDVTKYSYAGDGTLATATKPNGEITTIHAALTQPTTVSSTGNPVHTATYVDAHGVNHAVVSNESGVLESDVWTADGQTYTRAAVYPQLLGIVEDQLRYNNLNRIAYYTLNGVQESLVSFFDENGRVIGLGDTPTTVPGSWRANVVYDANGYVSSYTGLGAYDTHSIERDNAGHVTRVFDNPLHSPTGRETRWTYDNKGLPATVTTHGVTYNIARDGALNTAQITDTYLNNATTLGRDSAGNVTSTTDGTASWTYAYDANNRLTQSTDALANTTTYTYARMQCACGEGNFVTSIHTPDLPNNLQWTFEYGPEGRLKTLTDPDAHATSFLYQPTGEVQKVTDANKNSATMSYDSLGRVSKAIDVLGRAHAMGYPIPSAGSWNGPKVTSGSSSGTAAATDITAALNNGEYQIGTNIYQAKGDPAQVSFYRDATFEISYGMAWDSARRLLQHSDRAGTAVSSQTPLPNGAGGYADHTFTWALNTSAAVPTQESSKTSYGYERSTYAQNAEFDDTTAAGWDNRLPRVNETYTRDTAGRLTKLDRAYFQGGGASGQDGVPQVGTAFAGPSTTLSYRPDGRVSNETDADSVRTVTYDKRGLLSKMSIQGEGDYLFEYDQVGRNTKLTYPGGLVRTQQFDHEGRITSRCYASLATRCYTASYDAVGNPLTMQDPEGSYTFTYDALNRLKSSSRQVLNRADEVETYDYNAIGAVKNNGGVSLDDQRAKLQGGGTADAAVPNTFANQTVTVDPGGRITSLKGVTLQYNRRGRLIGVIRPAVNNVVEAEYYGHDSAMRRIAKVHTSTTNNVTSTLDEEYYVWDGPNLTATVTKLGTATESWIYESVDRPLRLKTSAGKYYYELDLAGNVRRLQRDNGTDAGGYRYSAFGKDIADSLNGVLAVDQPLRWKARQWDGFSGLYDMRARQWSPELAVFTVIDGLGYHDANSTLWGWPGANPLKWSDVFGRGYTVQVATSMTEADWWVANGDIMAQEVARDALLMELVLAPGLAGEALAEVGVSARLA